MSKLKNLFNTYLNSRDEFLNAFDEESMEDTIEDYTSEFWFCEADEIYRIDEHGSELLEIKKIKNCGEIDGLHLFYTKDGYAVFSSEKYFEDFNEFKSKKIF